MRNLYGTIDISKVLEGICIKERINYYKLKNSKYGLEIVKKDSTNQKEIKVTNMQDITDNEDQINRVLNILVRKEITNNAEDVIEDLLKIY